MSTNNIVGEKTANKLAEEGLKLFYSINLKQLRSDLRKADYKLERVNSPNFKEAYEKLIKAREAYVAELSKYRDALNLNKRDLAASNGRAFALAGLGRVLTVLSELELYDTGVEKANNARDCFERSAKIITPGMDVLKGMGLLLIAESLDGHSYFFEYEAVKYFERALKIYPNDVEALRGLEYSLSMDSKPEKAFRICRKLLKLDPTLEKDMKEHMEYLLEEQMGRDYGQKPSEWFLLFNKALRFNPQNVKALNGKGALFCTLAGKQNERRRATKAKELYEKARKYFMKAYAIDPENKTAILALADEAVNPLDSKKFYELARKIGFLRSGPQGRDIFELVSDTITELEW